MYLITGITGNVGGAAARNLLRQGKKVRALVRDRAKAKSWSDQGVELVQGEWLDTGALTNALDGVEGAYLMMSPTQTPSPDWREAKALVASYRQALQQAPPKKVVALSSIGSEKPEKLGLITSTHLLEQGLGDMPFPVAFVRAGSFFENSLFALNMVQGGVLPTFYAPVDRAVPQVATADIGAEVARLLTSDWKGKRIIELGTRTTMAEVAAQMSKVVGSEMKAQAIPREAWTSTLEHMGFKPGTTWAFEEMCDSINSGWIDFGVAGTEPVAGTTTAEEVFRGAKQSEN